MKMDHKSARACMCVCTRAHFPARTDARAQTLSVIKARISAEMEEHLGEDAWAAQLLARILQVLPPIDRARAPVCFLCLPFTHLLAMGLLAMGFLPFPNRLPPVLATRIPSQRISPCERQRERARALSTYM